MKTPNSPDSILADIAACKAGYIRQQDLLQQKSEIAEREVFLAEKRKQLARDIQREQKALGWLDRTGISGLWNKWAKEGTPQPRLVALEELLALQQRWNKEFADIQAQQQAMEQELKMLGSFDVKIKRLLQAKLAYAQENHPDIYAAGQQVAAELAAEEAWVPRFREVENLILELIKRIEYLIPRITPDELDVDRPSRVKVQLSRALSPIAEKLLLLHKHLVDIPAQDGLRSVLVTDFYKRCMRSLSAPEGRWTLYQGLVSELEYALLSIRKARRDLVSAWKLHQTRKRHIQQAQIAWLFEAEA